MRTLIASLSELDEEVAALVGGIFTKARVGGEAIVGDGEGDAFGGGHVGEAESGERRSYLRNVIPRYMENEDRAYDVPP